MRSQRSVNINNFRSGGFIGKYQRLVKNVVIPYNYDILCGNVEGAEKSHVMQNFIKCRKSFKRRSRRREYDVIKSNALLC